MICSVYNRFMYNLMKGLIDLTVDTIKCALLTSAYVLDVDHNLWSEVSDSEASGIGYTTGGKTLANKTVEQDDDGDKGIFDADDVIWTNSTITARYVVLYNATAENSLVCLIDFEVNNVTNAEDFNIVWHADGIITLALKVVCDSA